MIDNSILKRLFKGQNVDSVKKGFAKKLLHLVCNAKPINI